MPIKLNKSAIKRFIRNLMIGAGILLIIIVGVGVFYTWYTGQNGTTDDSETVVPAKTTDTNVISPTQPAENVRESAAVQSISSPIVPGSNASISIKTNPYSECTIVVLYNEVASTDTGLVLKTADDWGTVSWSWTVEPTVPLGKWPVNITCTHNELSAFVRGYLEVVSELKE